MPKKSKAALLNSAQNLIEIKLYYTWKKNKKGYERLVILEDKEAEKRLADETKKDEVDSIVTKWRNITWREQNDLLKQTTKADTVTGGVDIDYNTYRDRRIKTCLVSWDITNDDGNPVKVTPDVIDRMDAEIVASLVDRYEQAISYDEEEEKK